MRLSTRVGPGKRDQEPRAGNALALVLPNSGSPTKLLITLHVPDSDRRQPSHRLPHFSDGEEFARE
jgi:hypothetical protein